MATIEIIIGLLLVLFLMPLAIMLIWNVLIAIVVGMTLPYGAAFGINLIIFLASIVYFPQSDKAKTEVTK